MATPRPAEPGLLDRPIQFLKGVGPRRAEQFARMDVRTARDLLFHVPRRYEDASTVTPIGSLRIGTDATALGTVASTHVYKARTGLRIFQALLKDGTGMIECAWPGQPFLERTITRGDLLLVSGPVRSFYGRGRQLQPREHVVLARAGEEDAGASGMVLPLYPATEGLGQRVLRGILDANLDLLLPAADADEAFTPEELSAAGVPPLREALTLLHRPASLEDAERGRRRLAWDELFFLQLLHARTHHRATTAREGTPFRRTDELIAPLYRRLPFTLTAAQTRALREILQDMTSPRRMNRLLQGDVGSGKTIVALFAMLLAVESGWQAALMAPTEILAEQHLRTLERLLGDLPVRVLLLTGSQGAAERREALRAIGAGEAHLVVGTHALIQEGVAYHRLGLAVIDEQHRFGVKQRLALAERGAATDVLVMSATPIPRSLALTLYGDLDLSVLDEIPPGRQPVRTKVVDGRARSGTYEFVRRQVADGRQAYIVYPLVEESEKVDLRAATREYERLTRDVFPDLRVGLLHGQMPGEEKDATMRALAAGELDVLVATTVIEVGIDVPNASVMVVEHAERFGLSQLHQLRGRVGRGAAESHCILISDEGAERLGVLARTEDGFEIARADLRLRGMGDFFGARQHGLPAFRFFDPERDDALLAQAREMARAVVRRDPELERDEHRRFRAVLERRYADRARLYEVG
jgi:ATP-dependent DNA helicase RecG